MDWAGSLRREISQWARQYADQQDIPYYLSRGSPPTVMFEPYGDGMLHGNFLSSSYKEILQHERWALRLQKSHPQASALSPEKREQVKELDSSNSSDALLMNVFCHPQLTQWRALARLFGQTRIHLPEFGTPGLVPLITGKTDRTEIDIRFGRILVEAKLTEGNFTTASKVHLERYRDFEQVFETSVLPREGDDRYLHYQLIRNALAAFAHHAEFFLVCDARRPDLVRPWWDVMRCIRPVDLRLRCHFVLWQEVAAAVPDEMRNFLREKYGIVHTSQ